MPFLRLALTDYLYIKTTSPTFTVQTYKARLAVIISWQTLGESNTHFRFWRPTCYHYTKRLYWSPKQDSNPRPDDYKTSALPTELSGHKFPVMVRISKRRDGGVLTGFSGSRRVSLYLLKLSSIIIQHNIINIINKIPNFSIDIFFLL